MFDKTLLEDFELVPVKENTKKKGTINIDRYKRRLTISSAYGDRLGWGETQRLDFRKSKQGTSVALVPNKVGLVTARRVGKTKTYSICSTDLCLKIRVICGSYDQFEGWTADGILFFKPMESEDE